MPEMAFPVIIPLQASFVSWFLGADKLLKTHKIGMKD